MSQLVLDRIAQTPALQSGAPTVDDNDDVLVVGREEVVPVYLVPQIDLLRVRAAITEQSENSISLGVATVTAQTHTWKRTGYLVFPESSIRSGRISRTFSSALQFRGIYHE